MGERRVYRPTLREIAERTGVSIRTVSSAVRGQKGLSRKTAERIRAVADDIGYSVRGSEEYNLGCGVVLPDIDHPVYTDVLGSMGEIARQKGIFFCLSSSGYDGDLEIQAIRWFRSRKFEGVVLFQPVARPGRLAGVVSPKFPIIAVDAHPRLEPRAGLIRIDTGQDEGVEAAMLYLLGLGHKKISYLGSLGVPNNKMMQNVYQRILAEENLQGFEDPLYRNGPASLEGGYYTTKEALTRVNLPTAILAYNDLMAIGAMQAIFDKGLKVPQDVSVMGIGGSELGKYSHPKLSTVAVSREGLARTILSALMRVLEGENIPGNRIEESGRLVIRGSTTPPD